MENKSETDWKRGNTAVIKENCEFEGTRVQVLGPAIFLKQWWVPIVGIDHEDPDFHKESTLRKVKELPSSYIPVSLCPVVEKEKVPREVSYGIGQLTDVKGEIGMWFGPNPDAYTVLDVPGRNVNSVLIKFAEDGTDDIIYRWYPEGNCWGKSLDREFYVEGEDNESEM